MTLSQTLLGSSEVSAISCLQILYMVFCSLCSMVRACFGVSCNVTSQFMTISSRELSVLRSMVFKFNGISLCM